MDTGVWIRVRSEMLPRLRDQADDDDDDYYALAAVEAGAEKCARGSAERTGWNARGARRARVCVRACGNARGQVFMELCRVRLKRLGFIVLPLQRGLVDICFLCAARPAFARDSLT